MNRWGQILSYPYKFTFPPINQNIDSGIDKCDILPSPLIPEGHKGESWGNGALFLALDNPLKGVRQFWQSGGLRSRPQKAGNGGRRMIVFGYALSGQVFGFLMGRGLGLLPANCGQET